MTLVWKMFLQVNINKMLCYGLREVDQNAMWNSDGTLLFCLFIVCTQNGKILVYRYRKLNLIGVGLSFVLYFDIVPCCRVFSILQGKYVTYIGRSTIPCTLVDKMHWLLVIRGYLMIRRISISATSWITLFEMLYFDDKFKKLYNLHLSDLLICISAFFLSVDVKYRCKHVWTFTMQWKYCTVSCLLIISVLLQQVICFTHFCNYFVINQHNNLSQTISEQQLRKDFDISLHTCVVFVVL